MKRGRSRSTRISALAMAVTVVPLVWVRAANSSDALVLQTQGPAVIRVPTAALILSGQSGGSIRIAVLSSALPTLGAEPSVGVIVEVDGGVVAGGTSGHATQLEMFVYALAADGRVMARNSERVTIEPDGHEQRVAQGGLKFILPLQLPSGQFTVRVLVRNLTSGEFGLVGHPVTVPSWQVEGPTLYASWILEPAVRWVLALPAPSLDGIEDWLGGQVVVGEPYLPAARPVLTVQESVRGRLLASKLSEGESQLVARVVGSDGIQVAKASVTVEARDDTDVADVEALQVSFEMPVLPPDLYSVRFALLPETAPAIESYGLAVLVDGFDRALTWNRFEAPTDLAADPVGQMRPGPAPERVELGVTLKEISAAYLRALDLFGSGEGDRARQSLRDLETDAIRSQAAGARLDLARLEEKSLARLADGSWQSLLPIVLIYSELINDYRRQRMVQLSEHAIYMSTRLVRTMARQAEDPEAKHETADALVSLAGYLQLAQRVGLSQELLELAIVLNREHQTALLGLAATLEQQGRYGEAVEVLEDLSRTPPDHREGLLRLAVNLERTGKTEQALHILDSLNGVDSEDWIAPVAAQELARVQSRIGQLEGAVKTLEAASSRWPNQPALRVQLAWLLDLQMKRATAGEWIEDVVRTAGKAVPSARFRYHRWFDEGLAETRRRVEKAASRRAVGFRNQQAGEREEAAD